jgi:hypothetical protein
MNIVNLEPMGLSPTTGVRSLTDHGFDSTAYNGAVLGIEKSNEVRRAISTGQVLKNNMTAIAASKKQ